MVINCAHTISLKGALILLHFIQFSLHFPSCSSTFPSFYSTFTPLSLHVAHFSPELSGIGRWKTAASRELHNLTVYDITNLTLPTDSSKAKLVAKATVDLASCEPDQLGFCHGELLLRSVWPLSLFLHNSSLLRNKIGVE